MRRRKSDFASRKPREWGIRAAIAALALVLAYFAVAHSLAQVLRTKAPERAYAMSSYDGRITAYLSGKLSGPEATTEQRQKADQLARRALMQDATAVAAVATLGLNAQMRGELATARRYFAYSDKLSRRDLRTRLLMIEDAVAREDIPGALRNYDIALRTSRAAPDLLFPVLASAIGDTAIRQETIDILSDKPEWSDHFLNYVASQGNDPASASQLFIELEGSGVTVSSFAQAGITNKLIEQGEFNAAWTHYARTRRIKDRRTLRDPGFTQALTYPSQFDWTPLGGDSGISATIQPASAGGFFEYSAPATVGGPLLQQLLMLTPGDYLLEGRSVEIDQQTPDLPYWSLICVDGRELGRVVVTNSAEAAGRFGGRLAVPADCRAQHLRLIARSSNAIGGQSGRIDEVRLRPAS